MIALREGRRRLERGSGTRGEHGESEITLSGFLGSDYYCFLGHERL